MTRYESRTQVGGGYYFNTTSWTLHAVDGAKGELPGAAGTKWVRLPTLMMIAAALAVSLAFVLFIPVIGFVLFGMVVGGALLALVKRATVSLGHTFAPQWVPGEAWLARREENAVEGPAPEAPAVSEDLRKEVETRRAGEEPPTA